MTVSRQSLISSAALAALVLVAFSGCGPRVEVAKDKVLQQIDKVLGEMDVKQKKIDMDRKELARDMEVVREKRINAGVRLEQLTKKLDTAKADMDKLKQGLARVQPKLEEAKTAGKIELKGKEVTADTLNQMAAQLVSRAKSKESEIGGIQTSIDSIQKSADFLNAQEKAAKDMIAKLDLKIAEIGDKKLAIDAVKNATTLAGNDNSITDKIDKLSKEIDGMFVDVTTKMKVEEAKLQDLQNQTLSADELLTDSGTDLDATINEIDEILGKSGGN